MGARNPLDAYYTPEPLTVSLLQRLQWPTDWIVGEPCAGDLWIAHLLYDHFFHAVTSDIAWSDGEDFFGPGAAELFRGVDAIITNPPFVHAPAMLRRALTFTPYVAMLLRLTFLEPCSKKPESARVDLLRKVSRIIVCPRVSFYKGRDRTDSVPPIWLIFEPERPAGSLVLDFVDDTQYAEAAGQQRLV